jgi:hypothetical protein
MTEIDRLTSLWINEMNRSPTEAEAAAFIAMYREMQEIDREEKERQRVEHAREMSKPRR